MHKHARPPLLLIGLIILVIALAVMVRQTFNRQVPSVETATQVQTNAPFKLSSPVFDADGTIPAKYTCNGENVNPPFTIQNPPGNAKDFVLIMHDPDATTGDRVHWLVWNIAIETTLVRENSIPLNSVQGTAQSGKQNYEGPCPPKGTGVHRYVFELYALNDKLSIPPETTRDGLIAAMNGKVISKIQLIGLVNAEQ